MTEITTLNLKEAAKLLGFKSISRLSEKARNGEIPACKPGRNWVFIKEDLILWMRQQYEKYKKEPIQIGHNVWQFSRKKAAPTIIQDSHLPASEFTNRLNAIQKKMRKNMKTEKDSK